MIRDEPEVSPAEVAAAPQHRWRWTQFRMSTFLVVVTLLCGLLSTYFYRPRITVENVQQLSPRDRIELDRHQIHWTADRQHFAMHGWETNVEVREAMTLWKTDTICEGKKVIEFAFSPQHNLVAYGENDTRVHLLNLDTRKTDTLETGSTQPGFAFSPDGQLLATEGKKGHTILWDLATRSIALEFYVGHAHDAQTIVFSPDSSIVVVGDRNFSTKAFDPTTGQQLYQLNKPATQEIAFHPSGQRLAVAYCDGKIGLYDAKNGKPLQMVRSSAEEVYSLDWSPDGTLLVSSGLRGTIELWSEDLQRLHSVDAGEWIINVRFRPDMKGIFSAGGSFDPKGQRYLQQWEVPSTLRRWIQRFGQPN